MKYFQFLYGGFLNWIQQFIVTFKIAQFFDILISKSFLIQSNKLLNQWTRSLINKFSSFKCFYKFYSAWRLQRDIFMIGFYNGVIMTLSITNIEDIKKQYYDQKSEEKLLFSVLFFHVRSIFSRCNDSLYHWHMKYESYIDYLMTSLCYVFKIK